MEIQTIAEQLFFTTLRIETSTPTGSETGTAFIFSYEWDGKTALFLVTNKHVISKATSGRFFFTLSNGAQPSIGQRFDVHVDNFEQRWHGHPQPDIDIAVMPLVPVLQEIGKAGKRIFYKSIPHNLIPTQDQLNSLDAIEEVLFVGYPSGLFDTKNLLPIIRRGITATPLQVNYGGKPTFLVDASVFPGSSGSPVFICNSGSYSDKRGNVFLGSSGVFFLGVIAQVVIREEHGKIDFVSIPTTQLPIVKTQQMIDLGIVYKSSAVLETVLDFLKVSNVL